MPTSRPCHRETPQPRSPYPPIQPLLDIDLLVVVGYVRVADRLLLAEAEDSEHLEAVEKGLLHAVLQLIVEVDEDVAAEDHVEVIERCIGDEVVLREDHVLAQ